MTASASSVAAALEPSSRVGGAERDRGGGRDRAAGGLERPSAASACRRRKGHAGMPMSEASARSRSPSGTPWRRRRERAWSARQVQGRQRDQVPERLDRVRGLAVPRSQAAKSGRRGPDPRGRASASAGAARAAATRSRRLNGRSGAASPRGARAAAAPSREIEAACGPRARMGTFRRRWSGRRPSTPRRRGSRGTPCSSGARRAGRCRARAVPLERERGAAEPRARLESVTEAPRSAHSIAAASPASPPPTTATLIIARLP